MNNPENGYVGIIEYHEPNKFEWMLNDIELDALNAFTNRCYKASRVAILDLYLDLGMVERIPFLSFLMMLISKKHKKEACRFELVDDTITRREVDIVIKSSLFWGRKGAKWECDDSMENIENAFQQLASAKPMRK